MRDPHVESLRYSVTGEGTTEYVRPEVLDRATSAGRMVISDGVLRVEPAQLTQMAFWVLSALQVAAGGRRPAARLLAVEFDTLSKLGELTTNRGVRCDGTMVIQRSAG